MAQDDLRVIVIGLGVPNAGDDAVGLRTISALRNLPDVGCEPHAIEGDVPPGFLGDVPPNSLVVIIDSIQSKSLPGTVHCLKLPSKSTFPRHLGEQSSLLHSEIERLKQQGSVPKLFLVGVEIGEVTSGKELSEPVRKALDEILRNFARYKKLARDLTI